MKNKLQLHGKIVLFLLAVLFVMIAISVQPEKLSTNYSDSHGIKSIIDLLQTELIDNSITNSLFSICIIFFLYNEIFQRNGHHFEPLILLLALLFSVFLLIGDSFSVFHDFLFITFCREQTIIAFIVLIGKWILLYYLLSALYIFIDSKVDSNHNIQIKPNDNFYNEHFFIIGFFILIGIWTLFSLPFFPGSVPHDGRYQLNMFYNIDKMTSHHPVISTLFLGELYNLGTFLGINGGPLVVAFVQMVSAAWVFMKICCYIRKKTNILFASFSLVFYAVIPVWWAYVSTLIKDTMYFVFFAYYTLCIFKLLIGDDEKFLFIKTTVSGLLVGAFRNNGIYIIIPSLLFIFLTFLKNRNDQKNKILMILLGTLIIHVLFSFIQKEIFDIHPMNKVEALSLPLQQIARYVSKHNDEITEDEAKTIDKIVKYQDIGKRYDPEISDYVKNQWRDYSTDDLFDFFRLYFKWLRKDLLTFIEGAVNHSFGYFDPEYVNGKIGTWNLYIKDSVSNNDKELIYAKYYFSDDVLSFARNIANLWTYFPVLSLYLSPGAFTWRILIAIVSLLRRRDFGKLCLTVAPLMNICICCVSPWNGAVRYGLPLMAVMPLNVLLIFPVNKS